MVSQKYTHFKQKSVRKLHESRLFMTSGLFRAAQAKSDGGGGWGGRGISCCERSKQKTRCIYLFCCSMPVNRLPIQNAACFQRSHQRTLSRAAPSFLWFALPGLRLLLAALGQPAKSENVSIFHVETRMNLNKSVTQAPGTCDGDDSCEAGAALHYRQQKARQPRTKNTFPLRLRLRKS